MPIKTFRGQIVGLDAGDSDTIVLHTNDGSTGYRIRKLQTMQKSPGALDCEGLVVIWKVKPTTAQIAATTIDLSDNTILAVAFYSGAASAHIYPEDMTIIFDNELVNQDIYITYKDVRTVNDSMNYYIELEQVKLDLNENTVATLKDIRNLA
jgi:hypothetical protein